MERITEYVNLFKLELFSFMVLLITPITPALWLMGLLIFIDTFTGVWSSVKQNGWIDFKSRTLSNGVLPKITMYPLALLIASACESAFNSIPFIKSTLFILMSIELKSLLENFKVILKINVFDYVKAFIFKGKNGLIDELSKNDKKD